MFGISVLVNLASWFWLLWNIRFVDEQIFLHYNILFGVDLVGNAQKIFYLPLLGLCILIFNTLLGWVLFSKDKFAAQALHTVSVFCQIAIFISSSILVFLNV
ncbi:MAG: hypothetical protein ABII02_03705 [Candidatus Magasanikbacteria bacterium]